MDGENIHLPPFVGEDREGEAGGKEVHNPITTPEKVIKSCVVFV